MKIPPAHLMVYRRKDEYLVFLYPPLKYPLCPPIGRYITYGQALSTAKKYSSLRREL